MALPANEQWAKIQKELTGRSNSEQIAILHAHLDNWPDEWKGPYRDLKERLSKILRKLETTESVKSSRGQRDPFEIKREGDGQVCVIGLANSGKSAIVSALTSAQVDVTDYPFATQVPVPGMLHHWGAAIQIVDTPALVKGTAVGEGSGQGLLQLLRKADALAIVVDLTQSPSEQMSIVLGEMEAAQMAPISQPASVVLRPKGKGGIAFSGQPISKEDQELARRTLIEAGISHAEVSVRDRFSSDELTAQIARKKLLPAIIVANKNDVPGVDDNLVDLRKEFPGFRVIDVNFLDEKNFDKLRDNIFASLGLIRIFLLDRPAPDSERTSLVLQRSTTIADVAERVSTTDRRRVLAARIWGRSAKYAGQIVGIDHLVEEGDLVYLSEREGE